MSLLGRCLERIDKKTKGIFVFFSAYKVFTFINYNLIVHLICKRDHKKDIPNDANF
jgi:hypothetical protein